ncbi:MAG: hypothetical protein ABWY63_14180 [Hyphomicrobiaceae bacterium]
MTTLHADFITNVAGNQPPSFAAGDLLKMWVQLTQPGMAVYRAFNASSLGDDGVGQTTVYYVYAMANNAYTGVSNAAKVTNWLSGGTQWLNATAASSQIQVVENSGYADSGDCSIMVAGLLA